MPVKLSARESNLLVDIVVRAGSRLPAEPFDLESLSQAERISCRGLARKGFIGKIESGQYVVNQDGLDRAKQIY